MFVDTHCHIHEASYTLDIDEVMTRARSVGVTHLICVGTSRDSSQQAVDFAARHPDALASVGIHPHDTNSEHTYIDDIKELASRPEVVAIGEIGLDYYYSHSPRPVQLSALEAQLDIAQRHGLPVIFHVRNAFDDFWPLLDNFTGIRGVLHSFTDTIQHLDTALSRHLLIGVNGISTFTKDTVQQAMFDQIPLNRLLLETDAPFLTPIPFRGKVNEPAYVKEVAVFHADRRGLSVDEIAVHTTTNARALFSI